MHYNTKIGFFMENTDIFCAVCHKPFKSARGFNNHAKKFGTRERIYLKKNISSVT